MSKNKGFTGNEEAYNRYASLYNKFAEKLELLGASDSLFKDLAELCEASREIYKDVSN